MQVVAIDAINFNRSDLDQFGVDGMVRELTKALCGFAVWAITIYADGIIARAWACRCSK